MRINLAAIAIVLALVGAASAQVTPSLSISGRILNSLGQPVEFAADLQFKLYTAASGGVLAFTGPIQNLALSGGSFHTILDLSNANLPFDKNYWLETQVNGEILSPRQKLTTAPYAIYALRAGELGSGVITIAGNNINVAGDVTAVGKVRTGNLVIGSAPNTISSASGVLTLATAGDSIFFDTGNDGTNEVIIKNDGSVGIGTSPAARLDVNGNARVAGNLDVTGSISATALSCPKCIKTAAIADSAITDAKIASVDWSKVTSQPAVKDCSASGSCSQLCIGSDCRTSWLADQCNTVSATTGAVTCASGKSCTIDCAGWLPVSESTSTGTNWKCCGAGETYSSCGVNTGGHAIKATLCS